MRFLLEDIFKLPTHHDLYGELNINNEDMVAILEEIAKFTERVIQPLSAPSDAEGCTLRDGEVITPEGYKEAYNNYRKGGWFALACKQKHGGMELPQVLSACVAEMIAAANPGFMMYTGLNKGAIEALDLAGNEDQLNKYMSALVSGEWAATMNLTEPQAGTDLGLIKTKAILQADGRYRISGSKIFISGGDHDLTDNIIHLVLARTPNAPKGSKGVSLFLVPKYFVERDGSLGPRNHIECTGLEKKMGLNGSATCSMQFDEALGELIGNENDGLRIIFSMMNTMRISVGGQSVGLADIAYHNAKEYSLERLQGRKPNSSTPEGQADHLIDIPDVRRMLMASKSFVEGARALTLWLGLQLDISTKSNSVDEKKSATKLLALLTPVVKGYQTDTAEEVISMCLQCFGGYGYIKETGIEQIYRDVRISKIYEGATGVQAMDLLGRKVLLDGGQTLNFFLELIKPTLKECSDHFDLMVFNDSMEKAIDELTKITEWVFNYAPKDKNLTGTISHHYLKMMGLISIGYMWCLMALEAKDQLIDGKGDKVFLENKLITGQFFMEQYLPDCASLTVKIKAGSKIVMGIDKETL